jgi:putative SOS response-associated peptidase YedK
VSTTPADVLAAQFGVDEIVGDGPDRPRWNVAPTDPVPAISETAEGVRRLGTLRWGLLPSFITDPATASKRINARAETVATSPAFRGAFSRRRCVLPADGFYEWDGEKQPWFIRRADGLPLAMAGLWESWHGPDGLVIRTCAVITTGANQAIFPVHKRMPAILESPAYEQWLDRGRQEASDLLSLLQPAAEDVLERHPVTKLVNNVRNDGPELLEPGRIDRPVPLTLL